MKRKDVLMSWKIGRLTPINPELQETGEGKMLFQCDCWVIKMIKKKNVISGNTISCGCKREEFLRLWESRIHGMRGLSGIYNIFRSMKSRCNNSKNKDFKNYGWKWVKVVRDSFEEFYKDMWEDYQKGLTIDRVNPDWNYCKENCRRCPLQEQRVNRKNSWNILYNWKIYSASGLSKELNMNKIKLINELRDSNTTYNVIRKPTK